MFLRAPAPGSLFISLDKVDRSCELRGPLAGRGRVGEEEDADRFRAFYDEYLAVLDMPAEFYLETIERVFKNNELARGAITYQGEPVSFEAIENTPLMTVEGADDDICGLGQTEAAQNLCKNIPHSMRKPHVQPGAGHE